MLATGKIQFWGNSNAVRLPKAVMETAFFNTNDSIQIIADSNQIVIKKIEKKSHKTLKERLAGFDGVYESEEWDTGLPVGAEIW